MLNLPGVCGAQLLHPDPAIVLRLLLLAPLLEEWIVRAGLQEWLLRRYPGAGALALGVSAAAFSLLHLAAGPLAAAWVLLPGLALGWLYGRRRDWRLCALVHALFNCFALSTCGSVIY